MTLHWAIAVGIVAMLAMGLVMTHATLPPASLFALYQLHKSIGITILLAAVLRLLWRLGHRPPELPSGMAAIERRAAFASHLLLYAALFGLPLTGWAVVSASPFAIPTVLYGVMRWPDLPVFSTLADKAPIEAALEWVHAWGAWLLIGIVLLHAAAALRHHFWLGDDVLLRMLPTSSTRAAIGSEDPSA